MFIYNGGHVLRDEISPYLTGSVTSTISKKAMNHWKKPGDEKITNIPSIPAGNPNEMNIQLPVEGYVAMSPYAMYNQSDLRVADADFIRCRQISLQYDLPDAWVNKIGVRRASVNASLANPFFIAFDKAWEGRDPETANRPARLTVSCSLTLNF